MISLLLLSCFAHGETYSAKRIAAIPKLIRPEKITVGAEDQFQATVAKDGDFLVYTSKADLVAHLEIENLSTGKTAHLLPLDADSQDATLSDENRLAFTYYRTDARGEICFSEKLNVVSRELSKGDIKCLNRPQNERGSERSSPFWKGKNEIGYVTRDPATQNTRIVVENIKTYERKTLVEGKVWAPTMRENGNYLVYSALLPETGRRQLWVEDLRSGTSLPVQIDLPGIPGFAALSENEEYLYFSHFLEDTNDDNAIDGNDDAVVFRAPMRDVVNKVIVPEQLTASDESCSFPRVQKNQLFVTCAFDGSLDLYRLPATGIVPHGWNLPLLQNAYASSRSYAERLTLLNAMRVRGANVVDLLFNNFLLLESPQAATYYLPRTSVKEKSETQIYLKAQGLAQSEPPGEISRALENNLRQRLRALAKFKTPITKLIRGAIQIDLREPEKAKRDFRAFNFTPSSSRLEHLLYFRLAESLKLSGEAYQKLIRAKVLTSEDRVFYTFNSLRHVKTPPEPKGLPEDSAALVQAELAALKVANEKDLATQRKLYADLDKIFAQAKSNYYLRKAMNIRAIQIFGERAQFEFMNAVATAWLRDTAVKDTEFLYARDVILQLSREEGYADFIDKKYPHASAYFYGALSLTDDLESHAGFIRATLKFDSRKNLDNTYNYLIRHQAIDDNMKYVDALLAVLDPHPTNDALDKAITKLDQMTLERDSGVRYLLVGYAYLTKMRRTAVGLEIDDRLFQQANRNLSLAYDQGRDNDRVRAAAAMNLGLLHQRTGNYGLSVRYFALRKQLGFETAEEQKVFAWFYARSLFHTYQAGEAAKELLMLPSSEQAPEVREREAFYLNFSGESAAAAKLYAQIPLNNDLNRAKVDLGYGYALFRNHDFANARRVLEASLQAAEKLDPRKKDATHILDFDPARIRVTALGLLSQMGSTEQKATALRERDQVITKHPEAVAEPRPAKILNANRLAALVDPKSANKILRASLSDLNDFAKANGFLGQVVSRGLENYLAEALLHPDLYAADKQVDELVGKARAAIVKEKLKSVPLAVDEVKLALLWQGYAKTINHAPQDTHALESESADQVKAASPGAYAELERLAKAI